MSHRHSSGQRKLTLHRRFINVPPAAVHQFLPNHVTSPIFTGDKAYFFIVYKTSLIFKINIVTKA